MVPIAVFAIGHGLWRLATGWRATSDPFAKYGEMPPSMKPAARFFVEQNQWFEILWGALVIAIFLLARMGL
jgi:hypothetical protein